MKIARTAWLDGMLVKSQHFQQQDKYYEALLQNKLVMLNPNATGFFELTIDHEALKSFKFSILSCRAILPDGSLVNFHHSYDKPLILDITQESDLEDLFIAVSKDHTASGNERNDTPRFSLKDYPCKDTFSRDGETEEICIAELNLQLLTDKDNLNNCYYLPIAKILTVSEDNGIVLVDDFIPPCINIFACSQFKLIFENVVAVLQRKQKNLRGRFEGVELSQLSTSIADISVLQVINRVLAYLNHFEHSKHLHPEDFYLSLLQTVSEISTFTSKAQQLPNFVNYHHQMPHLTFLPLYKLLANILHASLDHRAIELSLHLQKNGLFKAILADSQFMQGGRYVLEVKTSTRPSKIVYELRQQIKIAAANQIEKIINLQVSGVDLTILPMAPAMIFHDENACYFELDTKGPLWQKVLENSALCLYITKDYPDIQLNLWFIPDLTEPTDVASKSNHTVNSPEVSNAYSKP